MLNAFDPSPHMHAPATDAHKKIVIQYIHVRDTIPKTTYSPCLIISYCTPHPRKKKRTWKHESKFRMCGKIPETRINSNIERCLSERGKQTKRPNVWIWAVKPEQGIQPKLALYGFIVICHSQISPKQKRQILQWNAIIFLCLLGRALWPWHSSSESHEPCWRIIPLRTWFVTMVLTSYNML